MSVKTRLAFLSWKPAMRNTLKVRPDDTGVPHAEVPFPCMWDLVEYLSYRRVAVISRFHASCVTVTFAGLNLESAQDILNEWAHAALDALQTA